MSVSIFSTIVIGPLEARLVVFQVDGVTVDRVAITIGQSCRQPRRQPFATYLVEM